MRKVTDYERERCVDAVVQSCLDDHTFLNIVAEMYVEKLSDSEVIDFIYSDNEG